MIQFISQQRFRRSLFGSLLTLITISPTVAIAQIIPDATLPGENSVVSPGAETGTLPDVVINGGAQRNRILFHSFDDFNVNTGQTVRFANPPLIEQIFSRVTGGRISKINGLLGVDGLADLFFLNPNGVIFGPNAELDVRGSVVVTTGDRILFNNDIPFSAVNPEAPPLLTITSPIGIQFGANPGTIRLRQANLETQPGETFALLGGDVILNNGASLTVQSGRLNLSGVSEPGLAELQLNAANPRRVVQIPDEVDRANIALRHNSEGRVQGDGNGSITIYGDQVTLRDSQLQAGINANFGTVNRQGGPIRIDATGAVRLVQGSNIRNQVSENALGDGGNIVIRAERLFMSDRSNILTETMGAGSAGDINISVNQLIVEGGEELTFIPSTPSDENESPPSDDNNPPPPNDDDAPPRPNNGENSPPPNNGDNPPPNNGDNPPPPNNGDNPPPPNNGDNPPPPNNGDNPPPPNNGDNPPPPNNGDNPPPPNNGDNPPPPNNGDSPPLPNNGDNPPPPNNGDNPPPPNNGDNPPPPNNGDNPPPPNNGDNPPPPNNGDNPPPPNNGDNPPPPNNGDNPPPPRPNNADRLSRFRTARAIAVSLQNNEPDNVLNPNDDDSGPSSGGARTTIRSIAQGDANGRTGDIIINASEIRLEGGVQIQINNGTDNTQSGNITIGQSTHPLGRADSLQVLLGAQIGNEIDGVNATGGNVTIRATDILLNDVGSMEDNPGGIDSTIRNNAVNGRGGNVIIEAQNLINRGGRIGTTVQGRGRGGTVSIAVDDTILLTGNTRSNDQDDPEFAIGLIASAVRRVGEGDTLPDANALDRGGDIVIRARHLILENGSEIEAGAQREGIGGEIMITTTDTVQLLEGEAQGKINRIATQLNQGEGEGGRIRIETGQLRLEAGSQISAATLGVGPSGRVNIQADQQIILTGTVDQGEGNARDNFDDVDNFSNISNFNTADSDNNEQGDPSATSPFIEINGQVSSGIFTNSGEGAVGDAGSIRIITPHLVVRDRAQISASSQTAGRTGNITIRSDQLILDNGVISAEAVEGNDGNINLVVEDQLLLLNGSDITVQASDQATGGNVNIADVDLGLILLRDESEITASNTSTNTTASVDGGRIDLATDFLVSADDPNFLTATAIEGNGGTINLTSVSNYGDLEVDVSSVNGFDGEFNENTLNVDPTRGLLSLPSAFSDADDQVRNACAPEERGRGSFSVTGHSGLPASPLSRLSRPILISDLGPFGQPDVDNGNGGDDSNDVDGNLRNGSDNDVNSNDVDRTIRHQPLQEAQGLIIAANGTVTLTSQSFHQDYLWQGHDAYSIGDYESAIALWNQAVNQLSQSLDYPLPNNLTNHSSANNQSTYHQASDRQGNDLEQFLTLTSTLSNLSLAYHHLGQWPQANQAIATSQSLLATLAVHPMKRPMVDQSEWRTDQIDQFVDQFPEASSITPILAQVLNTKAQLTLAMGNTRDAILLWQKVNTLYQQTQNQFGQIHTQLHQAQALVNLGFYDQSQIKIEWVDHTLKTVLLSLEKSESVTVEMAIAQLTIGLLSQRDGQSEEARQAFQTSLSMAYEQNNAAIASAALLNLGYLAHEQSQSPSLSRSMADDKRAEALGYYQKAIAIAPTDGDRLQAQLSTINLLQQQQRVEEQRLSQLTTNPQTPLWQRQARRTSPSPFTRFPNLSTEASSVESSLGLEQSSNISSNISSGVNNTEANINRHWSNFNAITLLQSAESLPVNRDHFYLQLHLAHLFLEAEQIQSGTLGLSPFQLQAFLQRIEQQARELGDRQALSYSLGYQGQFHLQIQQWNQARAVTERALNLSQQTQSPETSYRWYWQLGQAYAAQGNRDRAIGAYTEAVKALKIIRTDLASTRSDMQFTFRDRVEPLYRQFVRLLLQPDGTQSLTLQPNRLQSHMLHPKTLHPTPNIEVGIANTKGTKNTDNDDNTAYPNSINHGTSKISQDNLKAARLLIEDLQLAELQDYFQDACVAAEAEIDTFDPNSAVIYPIILGDGSSGQITQRLEVIFSMAGHPLQHYSTTIRSGEIQQTTDQLLKSLTTPFGSQSASTIQHLQQLYNWILAPAEPLLEKLQPETLVFVADGPLRTLPLAALHNGQHYLLEEYNVSLSPGLKLFNSRPLDSQGVSIFAGGISEARPGFSPLPFVLPEVQQIIRQIPEHEVLLNEQLTTTNFTAELTKSSAEILHLATHGKFGTDAASTFLLMWDKQLTITEFGRILQQRNQTALAPIELLVLSACETASGDSRAVLGIAGMAIKSGVRSAIAGLWPLNDQATAVFMEAFYDALARPNVTKVEAFQQAQRTLMQDSRFEAPYYWSPFVLVGNWQ